MSLYCQSLTKYKRIKTVAVSIGNCPLGADNPIRLQSMTSVDTNDTSGVVAQIIRIIEGGGDYIRLTAQGVREAENLKIIKKLLLEQGYDNPLVADIHFNSKAAEVSALYVEKVRINPGNYVDKRTSADVHYTDEEYAVELDKIRKNIQPLLKICKEHRVAIRIGVNHGSLSQRVMSKYGDTPLGLVMSLIEFLQICIEQDFHSIVLSIKASNTRVMVQACRLLMVKMKEHGRCYPVHLGVTEAGEGEDARLKSAIGIGTLLVDGIGDTIRVSLTEDPEVEIPVARQIVEYCTNKKDTQHLNAITKLPYNPFSYTRRKTALVHHIGGNKLPVVLAHVDENNIPSDFTQKPDYFVFESYPGDKIFAEFTSVLVSHFRITFPSITDAVKEVSSTGRTSERDRVQIPPPYVPAKIFVPLKGVWKYQPVAELKNTKFYLYDMSKNEFQSRKRPVNIGAGTPSVLYNGMVSPVLPYQIKGAIWYQGESNVSNPAPYEKLFTSMIADWRKLFLNGDFPFYFVQLAPFNYGPQSKSQLLRESQLRTLSVKNTGMAVTLDIGNPNNIHPTNKEDVGKRLALWALTKTYKKNIAFTGPIYKSMKAIKGKIILSFDYAGNGLVLKGRAGDLNFLVAGPDRVFKKAVVRVQGNTLIVSHPEILEPLAVRYAWSNIEEGTFFNKEGLPASSFRTDDWRE